MSKSQSSDKILNLLHSDLFQDYLDENSVYKNPFDQEVIGNNLLALGLESFLFLLLNIVIELLYDQDLPSAGQTSSENILEIKDVKKYYRKLFSDNFLAVDNLR